MSIFESAELLLTAASMTEHQDRRALEQSLLSALMEFLPIGRAAIYTVLSSSGGMRLSCRLQEIADGTPSHRAEAVEELPEGLKACLKGVEVDAPDFMGRATRWFPMMVGPRAEALLAIRPDDGVEFDPMIVRAMVRICTNYLSVLDRSQRDTLTGLLNRQTFDDQLLRLSGHERADSEQGRWLAVLDIDHFKRINDTYGHLYGDEVLILMARLMDECFRGADLKFRYGGEEFVVLLATSTVDGACMALERFRALVEGYDFPQVGKVTVSIGATRLRNTGNIHEIFSCADQALYFAKEHGRNQICVYEHLVASGALVPKAKTADSGDIELF
ncbi:MAG: GGDEF domain-containing protein [Bradymonadia bacterium]